MREDLLKIAKKLDSYYKVSDYYHSDYSDIKRYINRAVKSIFKKKNYKELVDNLDIILAYTNSTNNDWTLMEEICKQPHFISQLSKNLACFKYSDQFEVLLRFIRFGAGQQMFTKELIDAIIDLDLNQVEANGVFDLMNQEQQMVYLQTLLDKKKPIMIRAGRLSIEEIEFVINNDNEFLESCSNLFLLRDIVQNNPNVLKKVNEYIDNNFDKVITSIMEDICYLNGNNKDLRTFVYYLVKDVVDNEKVKYSEIRDNESGGYSVILFIGDKVIKIGKERKTPTFNNNPYIIKPLLRQEVQFGEDKIFVEVTEKVETNIENLTNEDLYQLYKGLREIGLVWTDIARKNVGRLKKDNEIYWKEDIKPSDETLGLDKFKKGSRTPQKNDYIILDADFIFYENDPNITHVNYAQGIEEEFEKRYQEEKNYSDGQKVL